MFMPIDILVCNYAIMYKKIILLVIASLCFYACTEDQKRPDETDHVHFERPDSAADKKDTVVDEKVQRLMAADIPDDTSLIAYIPAPAAVFTMPDTTIIKDIIEEKGVEGFYTDSDRNFYLQEKAAGYIESKGIKVFFPRKRYIAFEDGIRTYYLDTQLDEDRPWIGMFFRANHPPVIFNPEKVEKEFKKYMEK